MNKPKCLITGGSAGIGRELTEFFAPHSCGVSRATGHDIRIASDRQKIVSLSLQHDVFVNHAFARDQSQEQLLHEVFAAWVVAKKSGHIFNTGTYGTYSPAGIDPEYIKLKKGLDDAHIFYCQKIKHERLNFRMTLLRPGLLDTDKSRAKPKWPGHGVRGVQIAELLLHIYNLPQEVAIEEVVIESRANGL